MRAALAGVALVVAHAAVFGAVYSRCGRGTELVVDVKSPLAASAVPDALRDRVSIADSTAGAGLHHRVWRVAYRGGIERAVGATELVGPFQDPAAPACSGHISIDQRLLDGVATEMKRALDESLRGTSIFGAGDYVRVERVTLAWADVAAHPEDRALVGGAPHGYVRAAATVEFSRVSIPVVVAIEPTVRDGQLALHTVAKAQLAFENRAAQWASEHLGGDWLATKLARRELDGSLSTALAPPPPLALDEHTTLRFAYCDEPIELRGGRASLPFAVIIGRAGAILPPHVARLDAPVAGTTGTLVVDLDLDALNALLFELWRGGALDRELARAGLDRQFNENPSVAELLTLRLAGPPALALPPVIAVRGDHLQLDADARVTLGDGDRSIRGRVFASAALSLRAEAGALALRSVSLRGLELSCERTATTLVPCYGDLVGAMRDRTADFDEALSGAFAKLISEIFVERHVAAPGVRGELVIHGVRPSLIARGGAGLVRLDLDATIDR